MFFGRRREHELDDELEAHLAIEVQRLVDLGMDPAAARAAARKDFGNVLQVREDTRRTWRLFPPLSSWWLDVKLGLRMLRKHPGLALAGGAGIAVAVAIAAAGFSFVYDNMRASSLPLEDGGRVVSLELWDQAAGKPQTQCLYDFHLWREGLRSVRELGAFRTLTPNLIVPGAQAESVRVAAMSASGFTVARVRPLLGRYLEESDEREGAPPVIVLSEDVWRSRFAADPAILGRAIQLGSASHTVAGVMPKGFAFPLNHHFWIPLRTGAAIGPLTGPQINVFARLAPEATMAQAQAELTALGQRTALAFPELYARLKSQVLPYSHPFLGFHDNRDFAGLVTMQGLFVSLLILVCLNVAILVYTRTAMRQDEIVLRTALGASRGRIVGQLFVEALVLSLAAALAGVAIAAIAMRQVEAATLHIAADLPFWISFRLAPQAVIYAVALSVFAAVIVGAVPALEATRRRTQTGLRVVGAGGMHLGKTWTVLIIAQVGFAVALLPPAVAAAWQDAKDGVAGLGFAAQEYVSANLGMDWKPGADTAAFAARHAELVRRLEAEPAVSAVTFARRQPGDERNTRIEAETGAPGTSETQVHEVRNNHVDVHFFRSFEVPLLAGRAFAPSDAGGRAVIVNQALAQRIFGGQALGRRIRYTGAEPGPWYEIAGIVSDFPTGVSTGMRDDPYRVYHPAAPGQIEPAAIAIRLRSSDPAAFGRRLREIAAAVDPDLHLRDIRGLDVALRSEQWISRLQAAVAAAVTLSVLMLSATGVYALMSFTVSQRRREIGIRMALGAGRRRIVAGIFSRAFLQLGAGAALGAATSMAYQQASEGALIRANPVLVVPVVALVMVAVGFLAALGPTVGCLRIAPTEALREQ
jgi:predicted permease